jgi:hypothetical protein
MNEASYLQIRDYFQNLATHSAVLKDFVAFSQREWANRTASTQGIESPYLVLYKYEMGFQGPEENTLAVRHLGFAIMVQDNALQDDFEAQYTGINTAEQIALKILARIRYDSFNQEHFLYNSFMKETVVITDVEISAGEMGVDVFFSIKNKQTLKCDAADWADLDTTC